VVRPQHLVKNLLEGSNILSIFVPFDSDFLMHVH